MKKIYILTAVLALLSMSLNAQQAQVKTGSLRFNSEQLKDLGKLGPKQHFNDLVRGSISGMASILPESAPAREQLRAPLRYDATQYYTLGPFEGDNFDFGYGFPGAYDANQDVTITTQLQASEYEEHIGDEIVGFRLALYGNGSKMAKVDEFIVRPTTDNTIYTADGYAWALKDLTYVNPNGDGGGDEPTPVATYDDIVVRPSSNAVNFTRIAVVSGNTTITEWAYPTNQLPSTWTASSSFTVSQSYGAGYTSGTITIPGSLLTGYDNVQVVITAYGDNANTSITVGTQKSITTSSATYTWDITPSGSSTPSTTTEELLTQWTYADNYLTLPTGWSSSRTLQNRTNPASAYMNGSGTITIPRSLLQGLSNVKVVINARNNSNTGTAPTLNVNSSGSRTLTTTWTDYTWENISTTNGITINISSNKACLQSIRVYGDIPNPTNGSVDGNYVNLVTGQWHEFYLDQPVEFQMRNDATGLLMGYDYLQYPSSNTTQVLNPAAFNSQSTGHNHLVHMIQGSSNFDASGNIVITSPGGYNVMFYAIEVYDGNTLQLLTSWDSDGAIGGVESSTGSSYYTMPTGWTLSNVYMFQINLGEETDPLYFGYLSSSNSASITIANSLLQGSTNVLVYIVAVGYAENQTLVVNGDSKDVNYLAFNNLEWDNIFNAPAQGWYVFNTNPAGDLAVQLIFKEGKTPPPTITGQVDPNNENNYVITATGDGTVTLTIGDQTVTGNGSASITIPRTDVDQTVTATATAQDGNLPQSNPTTETLTVPKLVTASPTISVTQGETAYTITATADDPTATVTMTVNGEQYTGTGSVSVSIDRSTTDQNVAVSATAQESGKAVSEPAEQNVTVPALPITPTPTITYETTNATVVITATGEGTVYLEVDGRTVSGEGSVSITIMRSIEDQTVTANATAVDTNHLPSATASQDITIPALAGDPAAAKEGLLRMHLLIVDQLKEQIPDDNSHPDRYGYVLKWEQPVNPADRKESGTVKVPIQKTEAQVNGYYTLDEIDADVNIGINHDQGLTMDVLTADVSMDLPGENPDVLYYQMQGKEGALPALNEDYLTQLQYMKNVQKYEEMLETSPNKTHQYPANATYHYYDDSTPIVTGIYNSQTSFMTYAPSVSTWGIQRRYFEVDGLDNTYGAPIWKTAVGKVKLNNAVHERQTNSWNSVNWTDDGGNACSLYILKDIEAEGYLPHTGITNVEYEPYMFRVFVESKNGKLRPYDIVPQGEGDHDGEHLVAGSGTTTGPLCVWSGYCMDGEINGMTFSEGPSETENGQTKYTFTKAKVDREEISNPWNDFDTIKDPDTGEIINIIEVNRNKANAMFGALDNLAQVIGTDENGKPVYAEVTEDDLKVFVRFYYVAKGTADGHTPEMLRAGGASYPSGYGTESPGKAPSPWTGVNEISYHGEIVSQTYYNVQGMTSDRPFKGVNIIVTRYSDGTTSVSKVVK